MKRNFIVSILFIIGVGICVWVQACYPNSKEIIIYYNEVNEYDENEKYWGEIDGPQVVVKNKKTEEQKEVSLDFVPAQICFGKYGIYILERGDNYATKDATIFCYDYDCHFLKKRSVTNCNYIAIKNGKIFLQFWLTEGQSAPFAIYDGIIANAWLEEQNFDGKVVQMEPDKEGRCKVGSQLFYKHSRGYFSTEQEFEKYSEIDEYTWEQTESASAKDRKRELLEKEIGYDEGKVYRVNDYQKGNMVYGVINIWEEDKSLQNHVIPVHKMERSYGYKINLQTNKIEFLYQLDTGCVGIVTTEESIAFYEENRIKEINNNSKRINILYDGKDDAINNIILQKQYLLIYGRKQLFIKYGLGG